MLNHNYRIFTYSKDVLHEMNDISHGIGSPILNLALFLLFAWLVIAAVLMKGIRSSGKASYFLALFPYVIIGVLLIRALTLDGAWNGIIYFIKPKWDKILEPSVRFLFIPTGLYVYILEILHFRSGMQLLHNAFSHWLLVLAI